MDNKTTIPTGDLEASEERFRDAIENKDIRAALFERRRIVELRDLFRELVRQMDDINAAVVLMALVNAMDGVEMSMVNELIDEEDREADALGGVTFYSPDNGRKSIDRPGYSMNHFGPPTPPGERYAKSDDDDDEWWGRVGGW